ncbi:GPI-anchored protein LLG3-like isoform X1 [Actinidia eriantha]|uniref:GPI-anchored protein LLG3-like isoform X1 n=1 Tax=Actinidia eriantha TaxID=165200 RepID=UPI002590D9AE|nr:GPI-anchored protein LLG3-like isoform X1 [Actinidia eriantha]
MASNHRCVYLILFALLADNVFESHGSMGRTLLQAKTACTEDFESKNYTIITSQCKGPKYQATSCCAALKKFACPFSDKINDLNTDCAPTMFSYINSFGNYPPALFASLCTEGKEGLSCTDDEVNAGKPNGVPPRFSQSPMLMLTTAGFLILLFNWF